jgi:ribosomal protein S18 acetylase RimI-like enzyme
MKDPERKLRPATAGDAALLAELIDLAGEGIPSFLWRSQAAPGESPLTVGAQRAARDAGGFSYRNAWILEQDGAAAGMLLGYTQPDPYEAGRLQDLPPVVRPLVELEAMRPGSWYVNAVAVLAEHRGRGLGSALMAHAHELAAAAGCRELSLIVAEHNPGAVALYRRLGYAAIARRGVVADPGLGLGGDWILMTRPTDAR